MRKYALKGLVRGHHVMTEVEFEAHDDAGAWEGADDLTLPDGFITCQLVEKVKRLERNVPLPAGALTDLMERFT